MDCRCESYSCVSVLVNPCTSGTNIPISSPVTGVYTIELEFNGTIQLYDLQLSEGSQFVLPTSMLNENYTHNLLIEGEAQTYCYQLKTIPSYQIEDVPVPDLSHYIKIISTSGDILTDSRLIGRVAVEVLAFGQSYTRDVWFNQVNGVLTMLGGIVFNDGDIVWVEME